MASFRSLAAAAFAAVLAASGAGLAVAAPPPWAHGHGARLPLQAMPPVPVGHGVISGTVAGVDYGRAVLLLATPRGVVPVTVTPTTSIFRGSTFASFSDLARGARVSIDFSDLGGRLVAQIIRIH